MEQEIRFCTTSDGVRIAYAVAGEGPPLVWVTGWISHLELDWRIPTRRRIFESLAEHFTLVRFDKVGTGLSDRDVGDYSTEARVRELEAVVDQLRLDSFVLAGESEGGPVSISYAVRYPGRVSHLVLFGTFARGAGLFGKRQVQEAVLSVVKAEWGLGSKLLAGVFMGDDAPAVASQAFAEYQRMGATAEDAAAMLEADIAIDVSEILPELKAPTLIVHARADRAVPIDLGKEIAAGISGSRFVSVDGHHARLTEEQADEVSQPILSFLLEVSRSGRQAASPQSSALVTILFTDMEGSTTLTQRLGDAKAQELLRAHNTIIREALKAHGGNEIKHTGDGIMASFPVASGALECAVAMQRAFAERNDRADEPIGVRIGLNAGEPVAEDEDLFGTAVQLAARVCAKAEAGRIFASNVVRELAAGKGFLFSDRGDVELRGFEDPVRLYEVRWRGEE